MLVSGTSMTLRPVALAIDAEAGGGVEPPRGVGDMVNSL